MSDKRATIYMNDTDKDNIQRLMQALDDNGVDVRGPRGDLSMSELFRYLVKQELERIDTPSQLGG